LNVLTDRGTVFMSKVTSKLCEILGVDKIHTSPYRPQSNGVLERFLGTLKPMLGKAIEKGIDWSDFLPMALFAIRQVPNRSTGFSPHELVFGRHMVGLMLLHDMASANELAAIEKRVHIFNKHKSDRSLCVGDLVLLKVPGIHVALSAAWEGPYEVVQKISRVTFKLKKRDSEHVHVAHINNTKLYKQSEKVMASTSVIAEEDAEMEKWIDKRLLGEEKCEGYRESDVSRLLESHKLCFNDSPGLCKVGECKIVLKENHQVVKIPPRNIPVHIRAQVEAEINKLLTAGIIVPSDEEWSSPIVPIHKKDGSIRLCVDYREVNAITPLRRFWLPSLKEILDQVGPYAVLSKLDLTAGFHQVRMEEASSKFTTFSCPLGKFRFVRMPFGLKNAPAIFQNIVEQVLKPVCNVSKNYIDDIVVFSYSWEDHVRDVGDVLKCLNEAGLKVKYKKCEFGRKTMSYLGHQIGSGTIAVPAVRVKAMMEYTRPNTKHQLREFLGSIGYYREFIPNFASYSCLLTPSTSLTAPLRVSWTEEMDSAFSKLKHLLCNAVVLFIPTQNDTFKLYTDASGGGVGGCLHVVRDDKELPVAFFSRQLRGAERRYTVTELEALGIVESIRHFDHYLYGARVQVVTDHRACVALA